MGHKFALRPIAKGSPVLKYAQPIGVALGDIRQGDWVHVHNVGLAHEVGDRTTGLEHPQPPPLPDDLPRSFMGYRRADGRVGTRNYVLVVPTSNCSSHVCSAIAEAFRESRCAGVDGVVALPHHDGCGHHDGPDVAQLERTLKGMARHPNVAAVLFVGLGCEINNLDRYTQLSLATAGRRPVATLEIQAAGGTLKTIEAGTRCVRELLDEATRCASARRNRFRN